MIKIKFESVGVQAALIIAIGGILVAGINAWHNRSKLTQDNQQYKTEVANLKEKLKNKDAEMQRLEIQLTPFKTIALEKYTGSEEEALKKLAQNLKIIESKTTALEEQLAPRKLTSEQISIIAENIRPIKSIKIHFLLIASDPEANTFKEQIQKAIETGGWIIEEDLISIAGAFNGISLFASQDPPNEAVKALYLALKHVGFTPELYKDTTLSENIIKIKIGKKNKF